MTGLLHAHSGLRFLVLLVGVVGLGYSLQSHLAKKPFSKAGRILGSAYTGLFDLQVLLGLGMVAMGKWYPMLIGHLACMLTAAVSNHVLFVVNRKRAEPAWLLPLIAFGLSLLLAVLGVLALGRLPWAMTVAAPPERVG